GIASKQAFKDLAPYISWYSDYTPTTADSGSVKGIPMANGVSCSSDTDDASRMSAFDSLTTAPPFMFGFYEPDCSCPSSSQMSASDGTSIWNEKLAPLASNGTALGSPSMCKQYDEDWLTPFSVDSATGSSLLHADWTYTSIHVNKNSLDGVKADVGYYWTKYQKPIWVSEFACVDDKDGFTPCTDQTEIDQFISDAVDFFQSNGSVVAYGPSNGEGLGTVWPLIDSSTGQLTATGTTYLNKIKSL
ncbi:glycoside hydrolase family 128 protein, partial [Viridothelium virens]